MSPNSLTMYVAGSASLCASFRVAAVFYSKAAESSGERFRALSTSEKSIRADGVAPGPIWASGGAG